MGEFSGDSRLDLVAGLSDGFGQGSVEVLMGQGDGNFGTPFPHAFPGGVNSLAVGDFSGDGRIDIAAGVNNSAAGSGGVAVLSNLGGGIFATPTIYQTALGVDSLVAGDFEGTGVPDLVVGHSEVGNSGGGFDFLHNQGDGTFAPPEFHSLPGSVASLAVGDFKRDGRPELAVGVFDPMTASSEISVYPGLGGGQFGTPVTYSTPGPAFGLLAGDFYGDGKLDLAMDTPGGIAILPGDGRGGFGPAIVSGVPSTVTFLGTTSPRWQFL